MIRALPPAIQATADQQHLLISAPRPRGALTPRCTPPAAADQLSPVWREGERGSLDSEEAQTVAEKREITLPAASDIRGKVLGW